MMGLDTLCGFKGADYPGFFLRVENDIITSKTGFSKENPD